MESLRRDLLLSGSPVAVAGLVVFMLGLMVMVPQVSAKRWIVGSSMGWTSNVNYTIWAQDKHFYNGDWLCKFSLSLFLFLHGFGV